MVRLWAVRGDARFSNGEGVGGLSSLGQLIGSKAGESGMVALVI